LRFAVRLLSFGLLVASVAYLVHFARINAAALPPIRWHLGAVAACGAGIGLFQLALLVAGTGWHLLLRGLGETPPPRRSLAMFFLSQVGKYLPGNVGQYLGRWALAARGGIAHGTVLASLLLETAGAVLAGAAAALLGLHLGHSAGLLPPVPWGRITLVAGGLAIATGALLGLSPAFRERFGGSLGRLATRRPSVGTFAAVFGLYLVNFLIFALMAQLLATQVLAAPPAPLLPLAGIFAAAWVAGFVTPGAPAGLGVREAILTTGLTPLWGPGIALAVPILFRLVTVAGDFVALGVGHRLDPELARLGKVKPRVR
jgi:hypothetical protein